MAVIANAVNLIDEKMFESCHGECKEAIYSINEMEFERNRLYKLSLTISSRKLTDCFVALAMTYIDIF